MKILLTTLNARYIHSNLALKYLYSVAALVRDAIEIREFTINQEDDLIYTELMLEDSDVLCFSCYIWNIERILYLADTVKKARPETIVILGGPEVSHRAEQILKDHPAVDMILAGEAEETFPKLLRVLFEQAGENEKYATEENGNIITDFEKALGFYGIDGLAFRNEGAVIVNSAAATVDFLKAPFPYQQLPCEADKIVYYESSRGCPFQCTYCLSSLERGVRALPIERVKQDMRYFLYKGVKQVKFLDRTFNYDKERAAEIFRYLIEIDNKTINFHFEMCGELFDENLLALAEKARPGLFQFEIGVQSTNPDTIQAIKRTADFGKLSENIKRLRAANNIHLHLDLIAGLPFEDMAGFQNSFNQVYALEPHALQIGFLKMLPGTPIRANAEEYGYVYREKAPYEIISNRFLKANEILQIKMIETVFELYYNRGGFGETLAYAIKTEGNSAFDFFERFSVFYYKKGFQNQPQSKENLYRIFANYAEEREKEQPDTFLEWKELLFQDLVKTMNPDAVKKFVKKGWELTL
ncbi:MAG: DUF4080 domain-containing protein [Eubacteriales bacterium]|nr:DUF4080 domain-containing protein [Eubacteriales bacterium]